MPMPPMSLAGVLPHIQVHVPAEDPLQVLDGDRAQQRRQARAANRK